MTRDEAVMIIGNLTDADNEYNVTDVQNAKTMAIEALNQQKAGYWIKVNDDVNKIHYKECSCCSVKISFNLPFLDYCPKCGAKMILV